MEGSEYRTRHDGEKTVFDVTPAPCPKNKSALFIVVPLMFVIALMSLALGVLGIILFLLIASGVWYLGFRRDWRPAAHRGPSSFAVSPSGIEWNGRTFRKEDIHRLLIKNGMIRNELANAFIASGARGTGAFAVGQQYRSKIATVTNSLDLETGGRAYTLAGGLSETTAFGLMTDVGRILGLETAP